MPEGYREYVCIGDKLIFREGRTKGLGVIKALNYDKSMPWFKNNKDKEKEAKEKEELEAKQAAAKAGTKGSAVNMRGEPGAGPVAGSRRV